MVTRTLERAPAGPAPSARTAAAMPALFVLLWSSAFIAGIIGVDAAPPLLLIFTRFALAGLLLAVVAVALRMPWPRGRALGHVAVTGVLIQAVQFGALYCALGMGMPAAVVALVQGFSPVLVALLSAPALGERVSGLRWAGFALGAAGVVVAVSDRVAFSGAGVVLAVAGLAGLSAGTVYQKRYAAGMHLITGTAVQFLVAAPLVAVASVAFETPHVSHWGSFGGAVAWMVLVNSVGCFLLLNSMLRRSSASRVSTLFFLTPSVTALLAWLIVGQSLSAAALAGLALGGAGVLLASRS